MRPLSYALVVLLAVSGLSHLALGVPDYDRYQTLGRADDDRVSTRSELPCPRYALHSDYFGWINLAYVHPYDEQWTFQSGDPVEVIDYENSGPLGMALLKIDMKHYTEAQVTVYYTSDPVGWVTNLGNARTNNGSCGDDADNTYDAEVYVIRSPAPPHPEPIDYDVGVCTNDLSADSHELQGLLAEETETVLTFVIRDQYLGISSSASPLAIAFDGEGMFRIDTGVWDPEADACNDGQLWLALNRVVKYPDRSGEGAAFAEITLIGSGPSPDQQEEYD